MSNVSLLVRIQTFWMRVQFQKIITAGKRYLRFCPEKASACSNKKHDDNDEFSNFGILKCQSPATKNNMEK